MLSYQWADQQTVMTIRDSIKCHGYKVALIMFIQAIAIFTSTLTVMCWHN